jgi:hypothetical protein
MHQDRSLNQAPYPGTMRHRFLKGLGANSVGQIINLATRVLLPPLFLRAWGADVYGEWLVLSSFVAYLSLTDMGGQKYIVNRLTQVYAQQDFSLFRRVLHTGLAIFLLMPTAVFLLFTAAVGRNARLRNRRWQDRVLSSADMRTRSRSSFQAAAIILAVRSVLRPRAQRPGGGLCTTVLSTL